MSRRAQAARSAAPAGARAASAWVRLALCLVLLSAATADRISGAWAQEAATGKEAPAPEPPADVEQLQELVTTLEDPAARERFLAQLKALIASSEAAAPAQPQDIESLGLSFAAQLGSRLNAFAASMAELALAMVNLPDLWQWLIAQANDGASRTYWYEVVGKITAVLLLGGLTYRLVRSLTVGARDRVGQPATTSVFVRLRRLAGRTALDVLPAAAFAAVSFALLLLLGLGPAAEPVALALILATIGVQSVLLLARAILTPRMPNLRFLPLGDESAAYLYVWIKRFSYIVLYSYFVLQADVLRIPREILQGVTNLMGLVVLLMLVIFVLQNRETVASWLRGGTADAGRLPGTFVAVRRFLASTWHLLAIAYLAGTYIVWSLHIPGGFELLFRGAAITTVLLAFGRQLAQAVERLLGRGFAVGDDLEQRYPALQARVNRYLTILHRFSVGIVYVLIALVVMQVWGIDLIGWASVTLGTDFGAQLVRVGLLLALMLLVWELSSAGIEHYLEAVDETGARIERSGRMRTLLPLLRTALVVLIAIVLLLHTMSVMGVDLAPLLATAGVIGIAIGFGSQKLVQDVINGMFILFQDTISVGDFVEVGGGHGGTVERMSVRTMELRDLSGTVHTIPFSEITTVKNWAKEFGYALLDVGVAYREDVDEVMEVLRQIGAELEAEPEVGQYMLEPIDVWGVDAFADSAVIIKARIKTRPLKQHYVRRQFNRLMKRRFDELGIEIPFPHQTVYFGYDKAGRAAPVNVHLSGAAEPAAERAPSPAEPAGLRVVEARDASSRDSAKS